MKPATAHAADLGEATPAFSKSLAKKYNVKILRDTWGVPHIYGKKDKDVAFGLAWAQCEDNFNVLQESLMTSRGMMGVHGGERPTQRSGGKGSGKGEGSKNS